MVIGYAATLKLCDGIVWSHSTSSSFYFAGAMSALELMGATFRRPNFVYNSDEELVSASTLYLSAGKIVIDHKSYIQPGAGNIYLVDNLDIELRPGATLTISINDDEESPQYAGIGTVIYGQD
jgi:hypothetical protein